MMENGLNQSNCPQKLLLSSPRGFCAGVKRAIAALNEAVKTYPNQTVYCYHQIVHNSFVVKGFEDKGVKFINSLDEVPEGGVVVFSSHGVSPKLKQQAIDQHLHIIDATCPFVTKTHLEVKKYASEGVKIIYIGQPGHDEAVGTTGEAPENTTIIQTTADIDSLQFSPTDQIALVTQTTLSFDETQELKQALKIKFPNLTEPIKSDICLATQNRQNGVKELVQKGASLIIVLGSPNSSNSNKLKKVAQRMGASAVLLDDISELDPNLLQNVNSVGLTAGASLPEEKISQAIEWFKSRGVSSVEEVVVADESLVNLPSVKVV